MISFDHNPNVIGINHRSVDIDPFNDDCSKISSADIDLLYEFNSVASLKAIEPAPVPDTANFIQKIEKEREARERGETKDNRSFFSKYWMYIVPAVILLLVSSVTNPPEAEGQARQQ
jgi:ER membrane protein complex subunit 10